MVQRDLHPDRSARSAAWMGALYPANIERITVFDRLARLAVRLLSAQAAMILVIDQNQPVVVGHAGITMDSEQLILELQHSVCEFVRQTRTPMMINSLREYQQHGSLHFQETEYEAYIAAPLIDDGNLIGTICVLDTRVREWQPDDQVALNDLAASVMTEFALRWDIAMRRQVEEALQASEMRLRMVVDHIDAVLWTMNPETGAIEYASPALERIWGREITSFAGEMEFLETVHPDDRERAQADFDIQKRMPYQTEYRILRKNGQVVWIRDRGFPIYTANGTVATVVGTMLDITAEKEARAALQQNQEQYQLLFEANPQSMWVYDVNTLQFLMVNDAAIAVYGYSRNEFLAMTIKDIRPEEEIPELLSAIAELPMGFQRSPRLWQHRAKDGRLFTVESAYYRLKLGNHDACLVMVNDVTERRRLEQQLVRAQKLESLGRLAGSVAHDFNNVLTAISGSAYFLEETMADTDTRRADIQEINHAVEHATSLTRQLLAFARRQLVEPRILYLNEQIQETSRLLRRLLGDRVQFSLVLDEQVGSVRIDPGQLEQLLLNLAVNARDAMPHGGTLTIDTQMLDVTDNLSSDLPVLVPGQYAQIRVMDNGIGMLPDVQAHIFEPFFTTKEPGKGTGLGLAVCHGIVKQAGGDIGVRSVPGQGTTFTVVLPFVDVNSQQIREQRPDRSIGGREVILIAEDEQMVRETTAQALRAYGYTVLVAEDGPSALALAITHPGPIDLLVTDLGMPYMGGHMLASKLATRRPETAVLYMTGYADADELPPDLPEGSVLQKPFSPSILARRVREHLDRKHTASHSARKHGRSSG